MANMYRSVLSGGGTAPTGDATAADVLTGKTFSNAQSVGIAGTMPNRGAVSGTATASQPYTIPAGYHNGNGVVTAQSETLNIDSFIPGTTTPPNASKAYIILGLNGAVPTLSRNGTGITGTNQIDIGTSVATYELVFEVDNITSSDVFTGTGRGYILYT